MSNQSVTISEVETNPAAESLAHYLRGYDRANPGTLAALAERPDWAQLARQELDRRTLHLLGVLDDEVLRAMAAGTVDFRAVADRVRDEAAQ